MGLSFDPSNIQTTGIGIAAFLATMMAVYLFMSARTNPLARALMYTFASATLWAWFGFFYHIVESIELARQLRVASVVGIVLLNLSELNFAYLYLQERFTVTPWIRRIRNAFQWFAYGLLAVLAIDFFGGRFIVGALLEPSNVALAPQAGPLMAVLIGFYVACTTFAGYLLAHRARAASDDADRNRALILFFSMTVGLFLGGTRFTPWYGFDFYPMVGSIGYPMYVFASIYAIRQYKLLNLEVAAAQLIIFMLWTFTFFRMLLNPSVEAAIPDIGLFIAVIILGVFLLRSIIIEMRTQEALAKLTVERAKSDFVTTAAHQLRTPLSALRWSFNLLAGSSENLTPGQRSIVEKGNAAADNMVRLVDDLLNVSRMQDGRFHFEFAETDIGSLVASSVKLLEPAARQKRITLTVQQDPDVPLCMADGGKVSLAVQNIIDNAIKYTPEGGSVAVSVRHRDQAVAVGIQDTGIGFTKDEQARIFERFFRGDRARRMFTDGSGLGLTIAKTIVDGHGGTMPIKTEEGAGTLIELIFPVQGPGAQQL